jgi:hypothetical protein
MAISRNIHNGYRKLSSIIFKKDTGLQIIRNFKTLNKTTRSCEN